MKVPALATAGVVGILAVAAAAAFFSSLLAFGVVLLGLAAVAANRFPMAALVVGVILVALVPIYWVPDIPGTRVGLSPVIAVCLALLPLALAHRDAFKPGPIDKLVAIFVLLTSVSYLLNAQGSLGSIAASLLTVGLPYATFRLLGLRKGASSSAALGIVIAGVIAAYIAIREYSGWPNPFFPRFLQGHNHAFFARSDLRLGHIRPEASFGHAIALGMFLVLAAVLAFGLAWRQETRVPRPLLYAAAGVILLALSDNLVRGPLLMLGFAIITLVTSESRRGRHGRGLVVAAALLVLVNIGSFANVFQLRDATFESGGVKNSADYRIEIWRVVTDSKNFSFLGTEVVDPDGLGYSQAAGVQVGIKSFDNAFALIFIGFGGLTLAAFILIGLRVAHAALIARLSVIDHAWAAAILAAFINLMTVNLLTQFAHFFWIAIGLVAAAVQLAPKNEDDRADAAKTSPYPQLGVAADAASRIWEGGFPAAFLVRDPPG